jgi:hypothetical protein
MNTIDLPDKESVKKLLDMGVTISFPYKRGWKSFYSTLKIAPLGDEYFIYGESGLDHSGCYKDFNEAWGVVLEIYMSEKNLAYWIAMLKKENLYNPDLMDDRCEGEYAIGIKKLVRERIKNARQI